MLLLLCRQDIKKSLTFVTTSEQKKTWAGRAFDVPLNVFPTLNSTTYLFSANCTGTYKEIFFMVLN